MEREIPDGAWTNPASRYIAMLTAAREFGLDQGEIHEIVRRFPMPTPSDELAAALADAILARQSQL